MVDRIDRASIDRIQTQNLNITNTNDKILSVFTKGAKTSAYVEKPADNKIPQPLAAAIDALNPKKRDDDKCIDIGNYPFTFV